MHQPNIDQWLLGAALVTALGSVAWFGWQAPAKTRSRRADVAGFKSAVAYVPASIEEPVVNPAKWLPPAAQSRGARWVYDVFTPPEIFYAAAERRFVVDPPPEQSPIAAPGAPAGLELVAVKRAPFRLQLVGYVGGEGNFLGTFENRVTTEVFLAGAGRKVAGLDLEITDFSVRRQAVPMADGIVSNQWVATAVVRDELTGQRTTLTNREVEYTDELHAILAAAADEEEGVREVKVGEEIRDLDHTYRIERLQLEPPAVELTGISSEGPHSIRLSPRELESVAGVKSAN